MSSQPPSIAASLELVKRTPLTVRLTIANPGKTVLSLDKPSICVGGVLSNDVFQVTADGREVPYRGKMARRAPPDSFRAREARRSLLGGRRPVRELRRARRGRGHRSLRDDEPLLTGSRRHLVRAARRARAMSRAHLHARLGRRPDATQLHASQRRPFRPAKNACNPRESLT